jgi:predicted dehydrogenase
MFRIGMMGTESSHAEAFAGFIREEAGRASVSAVLDEGDGAGEKLSEKFGIEHVVSSVDALCAHSDAVMIFYRRAERHFEPAREVLEAGRALWLDKPFTVETKQARALFSLARRKSLVLDGGSTCRFCADVRALSDEFARLKRADKALAGSVNYMGHADSPYGGVQFYGPHAMSMTAEIFGRDARTVFALRQKESLIALMRYDDFAVSVHMSDCAASYGEIYTPDDVTRSRFGFENIYQKGLLHFLKLLENGVAADEEELVTPVRYLSALRRSLASGAEEKIEEGDTPNAD